MEKTCNNNVPTIVALQHVINQEKALALRVTVECENNSVVPDVPANLETSLTTESDSCKNEDTIEKLKDDISQLQAKNMDLQTKYDKDMNITMWFVSVRTISRQRQ